MIIFDIRPVRFAKLIWRLGCEKFYLITQIMKFKALNIPINQQAQWLISA